MANTIDYALIDGANVEDLLPMLAELDPPSCCLYSEPIDPDILPLAPYLVQLNDEVTQWLKKNKAPWGLYFTSKATLKDVRKHLRRYLRVLLPDDPVPATLRFYDPRNIWNFLSVLDDWQVHSLLGPIISIKTDWQETIIENDYEKIRQQYPVGAYSKQLILKININQKQLLDDISLRSYSNEIAVLMTAWFDEYQVVPAAKKEAIAKESVTFIFDSAPIVDEEKRNVKIKFDNVNEFSYELISYLSSNTITDDRSVRGIAKLMMINNITQLSDIPDSFIEYIEQNNVQGDLKATDLLIEHLGSVPV
jgi:hypothetical protein